MQASYIRQISGWTVQSTLRVILTLRKLEGAKGIVVDVCIIDS